jgi:Protein of unknown function DUF262
MATALDPTEFEDESEEEELPDGHVAAVVSGTDWTTETIVSQLARKNIQLNPSFQRRDAWKRDRKSRFIESLIVGLPIPQIVLAESKLDRGKFIVLDGKQRLLSILQFWGHGSGDNNRYALSSLTLRPDLKKVTYAELSTRSDLQGDFNALCNQAVRTVVIRNWKDTDFLHSVFLRLNTGSVKLSPQELRQALIPGIFSTFIDEAAGDLVSLQALLGIDGPDTRMRDVEILGRFLAFRFFATIYPGRMKRFLDESFSTFNASWGAYEPKVRKAIVDFDEGVKFLLDVFGGDVARKPASSQFNRAIFDALIYYFSQQPIRNAATKKKAQVRKAYDALFKNEDSAFLKAVESDTAGSPNTLARLQIWAKSLAPIVALPLSAPAIPQAGTKKAGPPAKKSKVVVKAAAKKSSVSK